MDRCDESGDQVEVVVHNVPVGAVRDGMGPGPAGFGHVKAPSVCAAAQAGEEGGLGGDPEIEDVVEAMGSKPPQGFQKPSPGCLIALAQPGEIADNDFIRIGIALQDAGGQIQ